MRRRLTPFDALVATLRGEVPDGIDWFQVIAMANHALLSPEIFATLTRSGQIAAVPPDVRDYLRLVHDSNQERNARLRAQLVEALEVFNASGIVPVLLKGAVPLFPSSDGTLPTRMTSDLDVAVDAKEMEPAQACLTHLGYLPAEDFRGMGRDQDVGLFELRPLRDDGRPDRLVETSRDGVRARIPTPIARAEHWIMHDMVKEGDFIRGRVDLRHLFDLAMLSADHELDWAALRAAQSTGSGLLALDTQLFTLNALFRVPVPDEVLHRTAARFHHWRRICSVQRRGAGIPLRLAGNITWAGLRARRLGTLLRRGPVEALRRGSRLVTELRPRAKL